MGTTMTVTEIKEKIRIAESSGDINEANKLREELAKMVVNS